MIIYKITNKLNNKAYIGQTVQSLKTRFTRHCTTGRCAVTHAIKKYGKIHFEIKVLARCNTMEEMNHREIYYIKLFNTLAPNGYNLMTGGNRSRHSEETKLKLSLKMKGRKFTREWREKITKANIGRRYKSSVDRTGNGPFRGRKHTPETKEKMRLARLKYNSSL